MKKYIFLFSLLTFANFSQTNGQEYNTNAYAFEQNQKLGRGVNIIGYDPIWDDFSKARMQEKHFKLIKEA